MSDLIFVIVSLFASIIFAVVMHRRNKAMVKRAREKAFFNRIKFYKDKWRKSNG